MADISFETLGSCPVPGQTPAGGNARYEPEYAAVLEEIEKLSFSGQGAAVSWLAVEENAVAILAEKSKDFQIAAYLGVALWQTRGLGGLLDGLSVLTGLLENFWETGWPALKRLRGRVTAIDWWHERTYGFLREAQDSPVTAERRQELLEALAKLDDLVSSLMPEASPLRDLTAAVQRLPLPESPEPPGEPTATPEDPPKAPPPPQPAAPTPLQTAATETDDTAALRRGFIAAGQSYLASARRVEPGNASHWQLSRLIIWGGIAALPASENGQTLLPVPDMNALALARKKLEAGKALEAALEAEDFFATAPFCLDAQETIHAALIALQFAEAARLVMEETAKFFTRLVGVETLSFADGTPFASPQTVAWLRGATSRRDIEPRASAGDNGPALASAGELMEKNKLVEALAALEAAKTASPRTANLRLRACQARLLREGGRFEAALALAEDIFEETTARGLDDWDPELALEALLAVRGAFALNESRYEPELRDVRRRIVRLRLSAALD